MYYGRLGVHRGSNYQILATCRAGLKRPSCVLYPAFCTSRLGSWNLVLWYLYMVSKKGRNRFLKFCCFWKYVQNCGQNWQNVRNFGHNQPYFQKKSNNQNSVPTFFTYYNRGTSGPNFSFLAPFLFQKSIPAWFWEKRVFVKNGLFLPFLAKIFKISIFLKTKLTETFRYW